MSSGGTEVKEKASTFLLVHGEEEKLLLSCTPLFEGDCRKSCGLEFQLPGAGFSHSFAQRQSEESVKCCLCDQRRDEKLQPRGSQVLNEPLTFSPPPFQPHFLYT